MMMKRRAYTVISWNIKIMPVEINCHKDHKTIGWYTELMLYNNIDMD